MNVVVLFEIGYYADSAITVICVTASRRAESYAAPIYPCSE